MITHTHLGMERTTDRGHDVIDAIVIQLVSASMQNRDASITLVASAKNALHIRGVGNGKNALHIGKGVH